MAMAAKAGAKAKAQAAAEKASKKFGKQQNVFCKIDPKKKKKKM